MAMIGLFFVACSSASLEKMAQTKVLKNGSSKNVGSQEVSKPKGDESDGADDSVTPPTSVAGAFLTCDVSDKAPQKQGQAGVGCVLKIDNQKAVVTSVPKFTVTAPDPIAVSYIDSTDPTWHWFVYVPINVNLSKLKVHVEVDTNKGHVVIAYIPGQNPGATGGAPNGTTFAIDGYSDGVTASLVTNEYTDPQKPLRIQLLPKAGVSLDSGVTQADIDGVVVYIHLLEGAKGETICTYRFDVFEGEFIFQSCSYGRSYSEWFEPTKLDVRCERPTFASKAYHFQMLAPQDN